MSVIGAEPPRLLFQTGRAEYPTSVSRDLRFLLYSGFSKEGQGSDLWAYPLGGNHKVAPRPFLSRPLNQDQGQFSPDGRWVAYVSNESGPREVWVAPSSVDADLVGVRAGPGEQVSNGGGASPRWARSGKELFYLASDGTVMVVDVQTDGGLKTGRPSTLFRVPGALPDWGVSPDGSRFLFAVPVSSPPPLDVILNWDVGIRH
jgi:Tol biopolymer transport system component